MARWLGRDFRVPLECARKRRHERAAANLRGAYLKDAIGLRRAHRKGVVGLRQPALEMVGGIVQESPWPVKKRRS